jgi:hypothetical protein
MDRVHFLSSAGSPPNKMLLFSVFNFGKPKTAGQWIAHAVLAIVALFLVWWMLRLYVV